MRGESDDGPTTSLIMSKCRLTKLLARTMPELELDAAVLGMEISEIILNAQPDIFVNTYYWSDARDVLCWINKIRWGSCGCNRAPYKCESMELGGLLLILLRKCRPTTQTLKKWMNGPELLRDTNTFWRLGPDDYVLLVDTSTRQDDIVPDVTPFESWSSLLIVVANNIQRRNGAAVTTPESEELHIAKEEVIKYAQQE